MRSPDNTFAEDDGITEISEVVHETSTVDCGFPEILMKKHIDEKNGVPGVPVGTEQLVGRITSVRIA